jgi:cysteine desulfurase
MIYLDYAATTPVDKEVLDAYIKTTNNFFANASSLHKMGQESNYMYEVAIKEIQKTLNIEHDIVFTANATEANNLGILGIAGKYDSGKIITTKIEHPSVYNVMKHLEDKFDVVYLDVDKQGIIDLKQLEKELTKDTIIVSIMWVNNIIGTIQPIDKVIQLIKKFPKVKLHVDAVQGLCKAIPNFDVTDIDLFTFSTHKIYGPKGIGGLFIKKNLELDKRLFGSPVQMGVKPGTFDLSLIVATAKSFKKFYPTTLERQNYVKKLWEKLFNALNTNPKIVINTPKENINYYIFNFSLPSINGETIVHALEQEEIYISTGSACSSKLKKPEKTIFAMTNDEKRSTTSVRISLSHLVKNEEIDAVIKCINKL